MSFIFNEQLASSPQQLRIMNQQWREVTNMRQGSLDSAILPLLGMTINHPLNLSIVGNAARTPAEAYREFDQTTKIEQVPAGEFATLTRLMGVSRSVSIGREVFEYRSASDAGRGQTSMSGQIGVKLDKVDHAYKGTPVPVHDTGFGRRWREMESMRAEGYDALVDDSRETERTLMRTIDNYLWDGDASVSLKGNTWLGIKNDPTVASATLAVDLSSSASAATDIRNEVQRVRDILYITNNCTEGLRLGVSREIMSNWERPFTVNDSLFGTIMDYVMQLRGITEIYEDSRLVGNQIMFAWMSQQGFHPIAGMAMSTYAIPRQTHNADFNFVKWAAMGFLSKTDYSGRTCALYAE